MSPLSQDQVAVFFAALDDPSSSVRLAALRTLVRLDLSRTPLQRLSKRMLSLLEGEWNSYTDVAFEHVVEAAAYVGTQPVQHRLSEIVDESDELRRVLLRLLRATTSAATDTTETGDTDEGASAPPSDPDLQSLAAEVVRQMHEQGYLDEVVSRTSFRSDLIPYLPDELASHLVTELFRFAVDYALTVNDAPPGNDIVQNIALRQRFTPDVRGLFEAYCGLWTSESVKQELTPAWSVRWLIAWTVSRAPITKIIEALEPALREGTELERELSARLVEESLRYANQATPPQFGGGEAPPEVRPSFDMWRQESRRDRSEIKPRPIEMSGEIDYPPVPPAACGGGGDGDDSSGGGGGGSHGYTDSESEGGGGGFVGVHEPFEYQTGGDAGTLTAGDDAPSPDYFDELQSIDVPEETKAVEKPKAGNGGGTKEPQRVVNTGFAPRNDADNLIDPSRPLAPNTEYLFWLDIGKPNKKSAEVTKSDVPQATPGVSLTVTVVGFDGEIHVEADFDQGEMRVDENGSVYVTTQPLDEKALVSENIGTRLYFPVRTPKTQRLARMRCQIYRDQVLLQSRLIEVNVSTSAITHINVPEFGFRSTLDYKLSQQLDPQLLNQIEPHRLSIMLNNNGDGTHSFHFYGAGAEKSFKHDDVRFSESTLTGLIKLARGTLRLASWGNNEEWKQGVDYKYRDRQLDLPRLYGDLKNLARWGYEFYTKINKTLATPEKVKELEQLMLKPGLVQIAMKESPSYVLPAAMVYDYRLDTGAKSYTFCPTFEKTLKESADLSEVACFNGACPSRGDLKAICPSGFWGFRHRLGMPLSLGDASDVAPLITVHGNLNMAVGLATDMQLLTSHKENIGKLTKKMSLSYAESRDVVFQNLKKSPHLVYFYCHGGFARDQDAPYLQIGPKEKPDLILQSNLEAYEIVWNKPRPLVFINGCHTTSLEPQQALEFITPLVTYCQSVGVIGTEITIFEELATVFAEECLRRFCEHEPIGESIRQARLKLLSEGNPLGLVYIPFVQADLKLEYAA